MAGIGYPYDVVSGDSQVFDPAKEARCPYGKVLIPPVDEFEKVAKWAFETYHTDDTFSANTRVILARTIAGQRACSYHYSRALATALVEAVGGASGQEYQEFGTPFFAITVGLLGNRGSAQWIQDSERWITGFIGAATEGGYRQFMRFCSSSEAALR
jgi:hypothetical protein